MSRFSETLMEHFQSPANRGPMVDCGLVGKGNLDGHPPFVTLYLRIDCDRVIDASFEAEGCGVTIACGSMLTEIVQGCTLAECHDITVETLSQALDGVPIGKEYCASVTISALHDALRRWEESVSGMTSNRNGVEEK